MAPMLLSKKLSKGRRLTSVLTVNAHIGTFQFRVSGLLTARQRRLLAVSFYNQIKPWLVFTREISFDHLEFLQDYDEALYRGLPTHGARSIESARGRLGYRIRMQRLTMRLSQAELAKIAKISRPNLSEIERGLRVPRRTTLWRIKGALDETRTLLSRTDVGHSLNSGAEGIEI